MTRGTTGATSSSGNQAPQVGPPPCGCPWDPPRPSDPPWRIRVSHRCLPGLISDAVTSARHRHGWSLAEAARRTGISVRMLRHLETGDRRPSMTTARRLITAYNGHLTAAEIDELLAVASPNAGYDRPAGTGSARWPVEATAEATQGPGNSAATEGPATVGGLRSRLRPTRIGRTTRRR